MLEKSKFILSYFILGSLLFLCLGILTSKSLLSIHHILIIIPCLFFLFKTNWKQFPGSAWSLLGLSLVIILSVLLNQDTITNGFYGATRSKYFLIPLASITPLSWYFTQKGRTKEIRFLLYSLCLATTVAAFWGLFHHFTSASTGHRNGGFFGQLLDYAHNLSYFLIIALGLFIKKNHIVNRKFLIAIIIINVIGFYFTYSRGPWLGLVLALPFFFVRDKKKFFLSLIITIFIGVSCYFLAGQHTKDRTSGDSIRIAQWKAAIYMAMDKPLLGYGLLNYEPISLKIKKEHKIKHEDFKSHAHNSVMEIMASTGLTGFFFFMIWLILWFIEMYKRHDLIGNLTMPIIICFFVGGLSQSTIIIVINLFFIMGVYALSQITPKIIKNS